MKKTFGILFAVLIAFLAVVPENAKALTITPPRLEVSGNPGSTVMASMTVINDQNSIATYYSSYSNFEAQGDSGIPEIVNATDDLGTWMKVPDTVVLGAGDSRDVPISITIPANAAPGGHFAAIFWGTQPVHSKTGNLGIAAKTGMLVLLRVNGDVPELGGITDFNTSSGTHYFNALPINFYYRFQNGGGDRVKPLGDIVMKDTIGITAKRISANPVEGNVLPKSTRKFSVAWVGRDGATGIMPKGFFSAANYEFHNFGLGFYGAHLQLAYGTKGQTADSVVHFFVWPWQLIIFVAASLLILFLLVKTGIYHYNKWVIGKAEELLEEKEHLHDHDSQEQPKA